MAFYFKHGKELLEAPERVQGIDYELLAGQHESYVYPVDGWHWFNTEEQARAFFLKPPDVNASVKKFTAAIQQYLNAEAASRGYGDERTAPSVAICTYVGDPNPKFAQEAEAFKVWRSKVWTACEEFVVKVATGQETMPADIEQVKRMLPAMVWPAV